MRDALRLTSTENPRIKRLLHLRKHRERREAGQFIAEGKREVGRALSAGLKLVELFWSPDISGLQVKDLLREFPSMSKLGAKVFEVTGGLFQKVAYLEKPEGILGVFETPKWTLQDLPKDPHDDLFLVASGIEKPGNLGAMARTALAAGATALLVADEEVDAFNPNAIRASTGAVFALPIVSCGSDELKSFLKSRGTKIIAAVVDAKKSYTEVDFIGPCAVVIGAEDEGLPPIWRDSVEGVKIAMNTAVVDSLNASVAAAVLLFQAAQQRALDSHPRPRHNPAPL